jgi:cytoskeletal protein RodZ
LNKLPSQIVWRWTIGSLGVLFSLVVMFGCTPPVSHLTEAQVAAAAAAPPPAADSLQWENWSPGAIPAPFKTESAGDAPAAAAAETPPLAKPAAKEPAPASPLGKSNIADLTPPVEGKRAVSVPTPVEKEKIAGSPAPVAKESPGPSTSPGGAKDLPLTKAAGESPSPGEPGRAAASPPAVDFLQNMENWSPGAIPAPATGESGTAAQW